MLGKSIMVALTLVMTAPAFAIDTNSASNKTEHSYQNVRGLLNSGHYDDALASLRQNADSKDADWNNLMGFAIRKSSAPDLDAAERYYKAALSIDSSHRGAMEYLGELYLQKKDIKSAQIMLDRLDSKCLFGCEEYDDLKEAVETFKGTQ